MKDLIIKTQHKNYKLNIFDVRETESMFQGNITFNHCLYPDIQPFLQDIRQISNVLNFNIGNYEFSGIIDNLTTTSIGTYTILSEDDLTVEKELYGVTNDEIEKSGISIQQFLHSYTYGTIVIKKLNDV